MGIKTIVWFTFFCWLFTSCWNPNCKWEDEKIVPLVGTPNAHVIQYYDKTFSDPNMFYGLSFPTESTGYIVGGSGMIYKTIDSADTFFQLTSPTTQNLFDVYFWDEQNGFITGNYALFQTNNGGSTWNSINIPIPINTAAFRKIGYRNSSLMYVFGGDSFIRAVMLKSTDGGNTWSDIYLSGIDAIYGMDFISDDTALTCGHYGEVFRTNDKGLTWSQMTVNTGTNPSVPTILTDIEMLNSKVGFLVGYSASAEEQFVLKTVDGGFNWNPISMGITTEIKDMFLDLNILSANEIVVSGGNNASEIGFVIRSKDGGVTWSYDAIPSVSIITRATSVNQSEYFVGISSTVLKRY
ncbi:MAG: YCF48-related protein [Cytophagaceae bacterium]